MYDTGTTNSFLFNCVGCGTQIPPPFYSSTGSVTIKMEAGTTANFNDKFELKYVAVVSSLKNISIDLNYGYGKVVPQLFNGYLPAGSYQVWNIYQPLGKTLIFSFSSFSIDSSKCRSASITSGVSIAIYDRVAGGNLLFNGCTQPSAWIYSYTGQAKIVISSLTSAANIAMSLEITYSSDASLYNCGWLSQPDFLNDRSMIIRDGSYSTDNMRKGQYCQWLITPETGGTTTLIFSWISLFYGSSVIVYDNSQASGTVLWNGQGPTAVTPPPLTSTGTSLYVVFTSNQNSFSSYKGFEGEYQSNYASSTGIGSGSTTLTMSSAIDLLPPGDGTGQYTKGINYTWHIQPSSARGVITLAFSKLLLTSPTDTIAIYDGYISSNFGATKPIASFSGFTQTPNKWYLTASSTATVHFSSYSTSTSTSTTSSSSSTSTSSVSSVGILKLSYTTDGNNYKCGFPTNPATLTASSFTFTDGTSSTSQVSPSQYCTWNISPRGLGASSGVVVYFTRFHILGGSVKLYQGSVTTGKLLFTVTNTAVVPAPIYITSSTTVGVVYSTNSTASGTGFSVTYYGVSSSYLGPGSGAFRLLSPSVTSLTLRPISTSSFSTSTTTSTTTSATTSLTTLQTAENITANSSLLWVIQPPSSTASPIYFQFSYFHLPGGKAYVAIYDGAFSSVSALSPAFQIWNSLSASSSSAYKSGLPSSWITTSSAAATLVYVADSIDRSDQNFEVSYYSAGPTVSRKKS
jgi:hypothetical protein